MDEQNLAGLLTSAAATHGERVALRLDETEVSYEGLDEASARTAAMLITRGLKPGERVGIMLPNVPDFAIAYYGVLRAGGVVVPMNVLLKGREVAFYLSDPEARFLLAWHDFAEAAEAGAAEARTESILVEPGNSSACSLRPRTSVSCATATVMTRRSSSTPLVRPVSRRGQS